MQQKLRTAFVVLCLSATGFVASGQDTATESNDGTAAIKGAIQSYVMAFNARDAQKLASHWSPEGVYISRTSGEQVVGRDAIAVEFAAMFAGESVPKLSVATESIEFISPNVALERGTATLTNAEGDVAQSNYRVVQVKRDGTWLIDRVTEDNIITEPSHYEQLKDLEWLIGEWVDDIDEVTIEIASRWTEKQNFISRTYTVSNGEEVNSSGLQIIGWDAKQKQIRSWLFDSNGGFVTGTWTKRDDRWLVPSVATLTDGTSGSFTSVFRPLEDGDYAWQKINRVMDGKLLPNIDEGVVHRK